MSDLIVVSAILKILSNDEGGKRKTAIKSGYRPNHVFEMPIEGNFVAYAGEILFNDSEWIYPGDKKIVTIRFLKNPQLDKYLFKGNKWWIYEVPNLIAIAEIVELP